MIFLLAGILIYLSFPRFIASIKTLYSDVLVYELDAGALPPEMALLKAQGDLGEAIDWSDSSYYRGQINYLQVQYFLNYTANITDIEDALADIMQGSNLALSLMPVAPYVWYDRALMDSMYPERVARTLTAIKMSVYADRVNQNLLKARVLFLWDNKEAWDDESRSIFKAQLMLLWELKRRQLIQVLKSNPELGSWLVDGLSTSPDELVKLERLLKKLKLP